MATDIFGEAVHHYVGAVFYGFAQHRGGDSVVDDERHAAGVGHPGEGRQIDDVARRVADALAVDRLGLVVDEGGDGFGAVILGKTHLDSETRQHVGEQGVGAAVELGGGDNVVAGGGQRLNGVGDGGRPRRDHQTGYAPLEGGHPLFQHVVGGVHDAGVDVARHRQVEQIRPVLGAVELVGHRLVDGHGHRLGGGIVGKAVVQGQGRIFHHTLLVGRRSSRSRMDRCPI
ncbi:hypothetical protein D3C87_1399070 [compost metagenome]